MNTGFDNVYMFVLEFTHSSVHRHVNICSVFARESRRLKAKQTSGVCTRDGSRDVVCMMDRPKHLHLLVHGVWSYSLVLAHYNLQSACADGFIAPP